VNTIYTTVQWVTNAQTWGLSKETWLFIGVVVFFVAGIVLSGIYVFWKDSNKEERQDKLRKVKYYESRDKAPDLIKELKNDEKAWVLWHVGGIAEPSGDYAKIQRMILVHPNSTYLGDLATVTMSESDDLYKHLDLLIGKMIKLRRNSSEDNIRLYRGLPSTLITFANPEGNNARALVQVVMPYEKATIRPCILVEKSNNEPLYRRISDYFELAWEASKRPEDDPISDLKSLAIPKSSTSSEVGTNPKESNRKFSELSDEEIQTTIRGWLDMVGFSIQRQRVDESHVFFSYKVIDTIDRPCSVTRYKHSPHSIDFHADLGFKPPTKIASKIPESEIKKLVNKISIGLLQLGCGYEFLSVDDGFGIRLNDQIKLDDSLTMQLFREKGAFMMRAFILVMEIIGQSLQELGIEVPLYERKPDAKTQDGQT